MHTYFHMKTLEASSSLMNVRRAGSAWLNVGACGQHVSHSTWDFILSWDVETGTIGDILVTRRRPWMSTVWVRKSLRHYGQRCMTYKISSFKCEWYVIYLTNIYHLQYWLLTVLGMYLGCPLNSERGQVQSLGEPTSSRGRAPASGSRKKHPNVIFLTLICCIFWLWSKWRKSWLKYFSKTNVVSRTLFAWGAVSASQPTSCESGMHIWRSAMAHKQKQGTTM